MIYFDNSATTAPCREAIEAVKGALTESWGNPSSLYTHGQKAKEMLEPMIRSSLTVLAPDADKDQTEAAKEAISEDMNMAMMNYMPLRGAFSFGAGGVSREQIEEILDALNRGSGSKS